VKNSPSTYPNLDVVLSACSEMMEVDIEYEMLVDWHSFEVSC
jgi:hypothetical protein